jgi:hypothetical protein
MIWITLEKVEGGTRVRVGANFVYPHSRKHIVLIRLREVDGDAPCLLKFAERARLPRSSDVKCLSAGGKAEDSAFA